jgi:hypothetical protein
MMDIFERTDDEFIAAEKEIYTDRAAERLVEKMKTLDGMWTMLEFQEFQKRQDARFLNVIPFTFGEDLDVIMKLIGNDVEELVALVNKTFKKAEMLPKVEEVEQEPQSRMSKLFATLKNVFTKGERK